MIDVYISNTSEDVWDFIQSMQPKHRDLEIADNAGLCDRELLACLSIRKTVVIFPQQVDPEFLSYYQNLFDKHSVEIWVPEKHSGEICLDILNDKKLFERLIRLAKSDQLSFTSYSCSWQFQKLIEALKEKGKLVLTPESPLFQSAWTVNFFGSKSGIRQVIDQIHDPQVVMAPGKILQGVDNVSHYAADVYLHTKGVVLKTNKAHSGAGVLIFPKGELPDNFTECVAELHKRLSQDKYWQIFPVVVEEFIDIDEIIGGGNPNVEMMIADKGKIQFLYSCGMRVRPDGVFQGVEIHDTVLPTELLSKIKSIGQQLGTIYRDAGYQGYYDVDTVSTKSGQLLITESNVRRTGGTHVYHAAKKLCGDDMKDRYILSINNYDLPSKTPLSFKKVRQILQPILFDKQTKVGLVLAAASTLKEHKLAYIIFGRDKNEASQIEAEMERLLSGKYWRRVQDSNL